MMNDVSKDFVDLCARFVDGELSPEEENRVLATCEQYPEHYRRLALAMIERRRINQFLAGCDDFIVTTDSAVTSVADATSPEKAWSQRRAKGASTWLVMLAASLLMGAFVGYGARGFSVTEPDEVSDVAEIVDRENAPSERAIEPNPIEVARPSDDAIVEETFVNLARRLKPTPTLDDKAVRLLTDNGVDVERHKHVFLFDVSDGRQVAIPAEFTVLRTSSR